MLSENMFEQESEAMIAAYSNVAVVLGSEKKYLEAVEVAKQAVDLAQKCLGNNQRRP